jgi:hypothetical protein
MNIFSKVLNRADMVFVTMRDDEAQHAVARFFKYS